MGCSYNGFSYVTVSDLSLPLGSSSAMGSYCPVSFTVVMNTFLLLLIPLETSFLVGSLVGPVGVFLWVM